MQGALLGQDQSAAASKQRDVDKWGNTDSSLRDHEGNDWDLKNAAEIDKVERAGAK